MAAQFPAAGNFAGKFFRITCHGDDSRWIGAAASKGCGKFPAPDGSEFVGPAQGNISMLAGNSQDR
jgi:hypothetical protein